MMQAFRYAKIALWMLLFGLAIGYQADGVQAAPAPSPLSQANPADVVENFLAAWNLSDFQAMYNFLSAEAKARYDFPVFSQIYANAHDAISYSGVTFEVGATTLQGVTAAVQYDAHIQSPVFGVIDDLGRTMRLMQMPGGWGVAWSSMDIFDGLTSRSQLQVTSRRALRGQILDRNGLPLVTTGTLIPLYGRKMDMPDVDQCLNTLANVLMRQRYDLVNEFSNYTADTVFFFGTIDQATLDQRGQELLDSCNLNIATDFSVDLRLHTLGRGSVHVLGYVGSIQAEQLEAYKQRGYAPGDLVGYGGIEKIYETELAGQAEKILQIVGPGGIVLREIGSRTGQPPQNVRLTLDRGLQNAANHALVDAFNTAEINWAAPGIATGGGVVVLDIHSGEVLAVASYPSFDPYAYIPDSPVPDRGAVITRSINDLVRNPTQFRPVQEQYFPGSTFKIITLSAALNAAVMPKDETFYCGLTWDGSATYGDTASPRKDWRADEPADSPVNMATGDVYPWQALAASCNPFFYEMGARLYSQRGDTSLTNAAQGMGLGSVTGLDGFVEASGVIPVPTNVESGINEAIGQGGVQVSILQMARMVASVANGGTLYKPYLVQQVGDGPVAQPLAVTTNGISPDVLEVVRKGMCTVTTDTTIGTAWFVFNSADYPASYTVCGKTGTAQSGRPQPYGWFVAFAPADNPQIAVAAMVEFGREGSETAAPIVRRILDSYFNVEPAPFPDWWSAFAYVPLAQSEGSTGG